MKYEIRVVQIELQQAACGRNPFPGAFWDYFTARESIDSAWVLLLLSKTIVPI